MKNQESNNRKSLSENLAKVFIIHGVPELVKILIDAIPDLTYERYIKDYKTIWNTALPATSLAILQKYAGSELEKTFTVQLAAGINRALNERANSNKKSVIIPEITNERTMFIGGRQKKQLKINDCLSFLNSNDFDALTRRFNSLPIEQRNGALNSLVPDDEFMEVVIPALQDNKTPLILTDEEFAELYSNPPNKILKIYYLKLLLGFDDLKFTTWASMNFDKNRKQKNI